MHAIYKYPIEITDGQYVEMPQGAKILSVQLQNEEVCLWVLVDPEAIYERRFIQVFGTGHRIHDHLSTLSFIGTVQVAKGKLVFHVFENLIK